MDVVDLNSVCAGPAGIEGSLDALVMNAGSMGGKSPMELTADGAKYMFASNVLGHVVLLEALLAEDRLGEVAVYLDACRPIDVLREGRFRDVYEAALAFRDGSYL